MVAEKILCQLFPEMTRLEAEAPQDYMAVIGDEVLRRRTANGDTVEEALCASSAAARISGFHIGIYLMHALITEAIQDVEGGSQA